jgi:coenzyme F420-0:L-glutamate ligase / coenzyme F420-1:gamma-L-glutamate ligase
MRGDIIAQMLTDTIYTRRSIRRYTSQPVSPELIDQLLEAATRAPSLHNSQPWRFAVITPSQVKGQLADGMAERLRADRLRAADRVAEIDRDVARSRERITAAPAVIVVCLSTSGLADHYERLMAIQSVAAAIQNLLLAAHEAGLGACWMAAPLYCPDVVREVLTLPDDWEAQALITIGYPKGSDVGKPKERLDLRRVTIWR